MECLEIEKMFIETILYNRISDFYLLLGSKVLEVSLPLGE